ncbi:MAG: ECF transporter S component [Candidatus Lokiarchaeota archaeon]|nr:ECF transporter S component [Candidatus Lokiarchaeota archaeon]
MITEETIKKDNIEHLNHSVWLRKQSVRFALIATFSALSVVLGYMLAYIPNIEIFTLMIFLSGFIMGKRDGMIIGLLSSAIFTFLNPLGPSPLPLFAYQLAHYSLTGLSGALTRSYLNNKDFFKPKEDLYLLKIIIIFGITGGLLTFTYDILSTFFGGLIVSPKIEYFIITYFSGIIFTSIHLIGNILGFIFILPGLIQLVLRLLD